MEVIIHHLNKTNDVSVVLFTSAFKLAAVTAEKGTKKEEKWRGMLVSCLASTPATTMEVTCSSVKLGSFRIARRYSPQAHASSINNNNNIIIIIIIIITM
jgi:hypothetical protein